VFHLSQLLNICSAFLLRSYLGELPSPIPHLTPVAQVINAQLNRLKTKLEVVVVTPGFFAM